MVNLTASFTVLVVPDQHISNPPQILVILRCAALAHALSESLEILNVVLSKLVARFIHASQDETFREI